MTESTKRCCTCGLDQPLKSFNRRRSAPDGLQARCRACSSIWYQINRTQHLANVRQRNDRARAKLQAQLAEYLSEHPCVDCGERDVRCLEFDHRDPSVKRANVAKLVGDALSWATVLREIEKCDVRCANCHRRITIERGGWWRQGVYEQVRAEQVAASHERLESVFSLRPG